MVAGVAGVEGHPGAGAAVVEPLHVVRPAVAVLDVALQPGLQIVGVVRAHGDVPQGPELTPPQLQARAVHPVHRPQAQQLREDHLGDHVRRAVVDARPQAYSLRLQVRGQLDLDPHRHRPLGRGQGGVGQAEAAVRCGDVRGAVGAGLGVVGDVVRQGHGQAQQTGAGRAGWGSYEVCAGVVQAQRGQGPGIVHPGPAGRDVQPVEGGRRGRFTRRRHAGTFSVPGERGLTS